MDTKQVKWSSHLLECSSVARRRSAIGRGFNVLSEQNRKEGRSEEWHSEDTVYPFLGLPGKVSCDEVAKNNSYLLGFDCYSASVWRKEEGIKTRNKKDWLKDRRAIDETGQNGSFLDCCNPFPAKSIISSLQPFLFHTLICVILNGATQVEVRSSLEEGIWLIYLFYSGYIEGRKFIPFHTSSKSEHLLDSFLSASFSRLYDPPLTACMYAITWTGITFSSYLRFLILLIPPSEKE